MRRALLRGVLGAGAILALCCPAGASALSLPLPPGTPPKVRALVDSGIETGHPDSRKSVSHQFLLHGSHHYTAIVRAEGNAILVEVARVHDGVYKTMTAYAVKGTVTRNLVKADLGPFGSISMRFHPSARRGAIERRNFCRGVPQTVERHGTYTGAVRFEGENDYVSVLAHRARGKLETAGGARCRRRDSLFGSARTSGSHRHRRKRVKRPRLLFAEARDATHSVTFGALTLWDKTRFIALAEESTGSMAIFHFASADGPPRAFVLDDALTRAKLSARKPFSGEGIYSAAPDGSTAWEGSLAVNFPGAPNFPLTGPQFDLEVDAEF